MTTAIKTRRTRKAKAVEPKFSDRIRFNWGYHDAAAEFELGRPRVMVPSGPQDLRTVGAEHDAAYHDGYGHGLEAAASGASHADSSLAWSRSGRIDNDD